MPLKIAIIGGGPAGLVLCLLLDKLGLNSTVYEQEECISGRNQGGSLDIDQKSGILALKAAGLYEKFQTLVHQGAEAVRVCDKHGNILLDMTHERGKPEIDRHDLREMLIEANDAKCIKWGYKLRQMDRSTTSWKLRFHNGEVVEHVDLVIGADGAWSQVRKVLSDVSPYHSGATFIELHLHPKSIQDFEASNLAGKGAFLALGDGKGLLSQRQVDRSVRSYIALRLPENPKSLADLGISEAAPKQELVDRFYAGWDSKLRDLILCADGDIFVRPLYMLPPGWRWETREGVTLLGDAAHLMTPFSGEGVNMALLDALELYEKIKDAQNGWNASDLDSIRVGLFEAVRSYEIDMLERSKVKAAENAIALDTILTPDSPGKLLEFMAQGLP